MADALAAARVELIDRAFVPVRHACRTPPRLRPFRGDARSHDPSARRDPPYGLDAIVMDADDPLVEIDGGADMVRDDRDAIPDPKRPCIFSERQHAMLLPQPRDPRRWIGREVAVAASRLPRPIGRERLAPGLNDGGS